MFLFSLSDYGGSSTAKYQTYNPGFSSKSSYMYSGSKTMVSRTLNWKCSFSEWWTDHVMLTRIIKKKPKPHQSLCADVTSGSTRTQQVWYFTVGCEDQLGGFQVQPLDSSCSGWRWLCAKFSAVSAFYIPMNNNRWSQLLFSSSSAFVSEVGLQLPVCRPRNGPVPQDQCWRWRGWRHRWRGGWGFLPGRLPHGRLPRDHQAAEPDGPRTPVHVCNGAASSAGESLDGWWQRCRQLDLWPGRHLQPPVHSERSQRLHQPDEARRRHHDAPISKWNAFPRWRDDRGRPDDRPAAFLQRPSPPHHQQDYKPKPDEHGLHVRDHAAADVGREQLRREWRAGQSGTRVHLVRHVWFPGEPGNAAPRHLVPCHVNQKHAERGQGHGHLRWADGDGSQHGQPQRVRTHY